MVKSRLTTLDAKVNFNIIIIKSYESLIYVDTELSNFYYILIY